eukprot:TRINITY_DN18728_c0_g1_i2.p1 TRINITY_DN18728_c0_g1~~TRINITY_DN18728_c0_g1_i2.p1  ORF type:complete len:227 (+),score=29.63 TRINITY_DN18728_c0_g1_i2:330-1010(+)
MGGSSVLDISRAPLKTGCLVTELAQVQKDGFHTFRCNDGFADLDWQRSIFKRWHGLGMNSDLTVYRIAPVYAARRDAQSVVGQVGQPENGTARQAAAPVAWAVSKDSHISPSCGETEGLCGLILHADTPLTGCDGYVGESTGAFFCPSFEEEDMLRETATDVARALGIAGSPGYDAGSVPLIALTDPADPFGQKYLFDVAVVLYALTLTSLVAFQCELMCESCRGD